MTPNENTSLLTCLVLKPDVINRYGNLRSLTLPTPKGEIEVLPGHAELFVALIEGSIILSGRTKRQIKITGGSCHVSYDGNVRIIL